MNNRIPGAEFDELLHADDTILISTDTETINLFINTLEEEAENIGLSLNTKHVKQSLWENM